MMKRLIAGVFAVAAIGAVVAEDRPDSFAGPGFTVDGQLVAPQDYREWIFLSSGLGMTYGPLRPDAASAPAFDNVFVNPPAYRSFLKTGQWPEHTVFILEVRTSASRSSINQDGHFQTGIRGLEAEVKDSARFPGKWAFFQIKEGARTGTLIPQGATCYACHGANGAVDNTFVQFYPTLIDAARAHGSYREPAAATDK